MRFEKRRYETRAVRALRTALPRDKRVIAVGPTGSGKTVIASLLVKQEPRWKRVLFLAHRFELVDQAYNALTALGLRVGVIMATDEAVNGLGRFDPDARVQVGSVQTIARRGVPDGTDLIVFDEAHRVMADSYQQIAASCPRAQVLGLTATPVRMDGRGLADFFVSMVTIAVPSELYADGFLAEPRVYTAPPGVIAELVRRSKGARSVKGDYTPKDLAHIVDSDMLIGEVVSEAIRIAPKVPKLVFAGSVKHSKALALRFGRRGIVAAHADGETDDAERVQILDRFRRGTIEVICNVDVLSEGYDLPALGAVILARPTRSIGRYFQMCGRVMRPYRNRKPIVIDHGGNVLRHQWLPSEDYPWSLDGSVEREPCDAIYRACCECLVAIGIGCTECPACGAEQPRHVRVDERSEIDIKLEEMQRAKMEEVRKRVESMAERKGEGSEWIDLVMRDMAA